MKTLKIVFTIILVSVIVFKGLKIYNNFNISREIENQEKNKSKKSAEVLYECFDLENKSKRTLNDSMKLIEYCLKEYGSEE